MSELNLQNQAYIFLAFAQNSNREKLSQLKEESRAIRNVLLPLDAKGRLRLWKEDAAVIDDIPDVLRKLEKQIAILHFGGHANAGQLLFEDGKGYKTGLAGLLADLQPNLKVLFLNGCETQGQVDEYLQRGVRMVIATTKEIGDELAKDFAVNFYKRLAEGSSIRKAFELTADEDAFKYNTRLSKEERIVYRRVGPYDEKVNEKRQREEKLPYRLHVLEESKDLLDWSIPPVLQYPHLLTTVPGLSGRQTLIGREEEMKRLYEVLDIKTLEEGQKRKDSSLETVPRVCLQGMGGIGKTTLALSFVQQYGGLFNHLAWLAQSTAGSKLAPGSEQKETGSRVGRLEETFTTNLELIENLKLKEIAEANPKALFQEIVRRIRKLPAPCLLVIDNFEWADQLEEELLTTLEALPPDCHVLLSSRQKVPNEVYTILEVDFLQEGSALELFNRHFYKKLPSKNKNDKLGKKIIEAVDYHTLTIELVAKMAKSRKMKLPKLVELLQVKRAKVNELADIKGVRHRQQRSIKRVFSYLEEIFDLAQIEEEEKWLLKQFVAMPSFYISFEMLEDLLRPQELSDSLQEVFPLLPDRLGESGWLLLNEENETYKLHPVLQDVLSEKIPPSLEEVKTLLSSVTDKLTIDEAKDNPLNKFPWAPFGESLLAQLGVDQKPEIAFLYNSIGLVYKAMGKYREALRSHKKTLAIAKTELDVNDPSMGTCYHNLANDYLDLGQLKKALKYHQKALAIRESALEANDFNLALSYNGVAIVYFGLGQYKKALEYHQKDLDIRNAVLKPGDLRLAASYNNIAQTYRELNQHKEALIYQRKALNIFKTAMDRNHPSLAIIYNQIAETYRVHGQYKKALKHHNKALKIRKAVLDSAHPDLAGSYNNVALVYSDVGKNKKALKYYEKAVEIFETASEVNPLKSAQVYYNFAREYHAIGQYNLALEYHEKALVIREKALDANHPKLADSYSAITETYLNAHQYKEALNYNIKALDIRKSILGANHPGLLEPYSYIILSHQRLGQYAKALKYQMKALSILEVVLNAGHPSLIIWYDNIAESHQQLGEHEEAERYQEKIKAIERTSDARLLAQFYYSIAKTLLAFGQRDKAEVYQTKAKSIEKKEN